MKATIEHLSVSDLLQLLGLDDKPVLEDDVATEKSVEQCVAWLRGRRTWRDVATEALEKGDFPRALVARARSLGSGERLPEPIEAGIARGWEALRRRTSDHRTAIGRLPHAADVGILFAEVATIRREASSVADLGSSLPGSYKDACAALDAAARLEKLAGDADSVREMVAEEALSYKKRLVASTKNALRALLEIAESEVSHIDDSGFLLALRAVPELLHTRELDLLERVANHNALLDEELLADLALRVRTTTAASTRGLAISPSIERSPSTPPIRLSAISDTLFSSEPPSPRGLENRSDLAATKKQMQVLVGDAEIASRWMRVARGTTAPELQRLALGHALLSFGRAHLDRDQYRLAGELLRDAVIALSVSDDWFDTKAFDDASMALVTSRVWPRMSVSRASGVRPSELAGRPEVIFSWLFENDAVEVLAELWADMPDGSDERFFEVLLLRFANAIELRHACASAALTASRLRSRPLPTMNRVLWLLPPEQRTRELTDALYASATELSGGGLALTIGARKVLTSSAETIRSCLTSAPSEPLSVMVGGRLADLLVRIASADTHGGEPRLSITPAVRTFFPHECSADVYLPITVENDRGGGPASEMSLQVSLEGGSDKYSPQVEVGEFPVPLLDAGDTYTGHALLQLNEDAALHSQAWSFKASLLRGSDVVLTSRFNVAVRARTRRANPFSAGQAIQDDQFFVGRDAQLAVLLDALCGDRRDVTPLVYGLRRIGKTSLVRRLLRHPEVLRRYKVDYWDVEDLQTTLTTTQFLIQFAERVRELLPRTGWQRVRFRRDEFREDPYAAFESFCNSIEDLELPFLILVAIDEFDNLMNIIGDGARRSETSGGPLPPNEVLQPQTLGALRKMLMKGGAIRLVLCGLPDILEKSSYEDRLFGLVHGVEVGPFHRAEAEAVVRLAGGDMPFAGDTRERLFDATGMQPYLLQLVCNHMYSRMMTSGRDMITVLDLQETIERDIVPNESSFTNYLELIRDEDRGLLRALALAQKSVVGRRRYVTPGEVVEELWKAGESRATVEAVSAHLRALARESRPLVTESGDYRGNFRLVIGLLADRLIRRSL